MGSAIWTKDEARATRVAKQIQAGIVMVNCPFSAFPGTPFGGYKQSGFGRELCIETLDLYTETKSIVILLWKPSIKSIWCLINQRMSTSHSRMSWIRTPIHNIDKEEDTEMIKHISRGRVRCYGKRNCLC